MHCEVTLTNNERLYFYGIRLMEFKFAKKTKKKNSLNVFWCPPVIFCPIGNNNSLLVTDRILKIPLILTITFSRFKMCLYFEHLPCKCLIIFFLERPVWSQKKKIWLNNMTLKWHVHCESPYFDVMQAHVEVLIIEARTFRNKKKTLKLKTVQK